MPATSPKPPKGYLDFVARYPALGKAWDAVNKAGDQGPLDQKSIRLLKLGIAMGALREGAIRSSVRKALAIGITREEIGQAIALAVGTMGFPSTVAIHSWVAKLLDPQPLAGESAESGEPSEPGEPGKPSGQS